MKITEPLGSSLRSTGLLALRLITGLTMLIGHGWPKYLARADKAAPTFPAILPGGSEVDRAVIFAEVVCAALVAAGLLTRLAAIPLAITMGVAFFKIHGGVVFGEGGGELALIYGAAFLALIFTGPGGISADGFLFPQVRKLKDD